MSTFSIQRLVGAEAIVSGTDINGVSGSTIVSTAQWDEVQGDTAFDQATEAFEAAVEDFFRPLTEAAEALNTSVTRETKDPVGYVVLREAVPATPGQSEQIVKLSRDSIVLRLIEQGESDRLVWVNDSLAVTEVGQPALPVDTGVHAHDADPA